MTRDQVFISYSHADSEWLERLQTMLAPLKRKGTVKVWADTDIDPGKKWKAEIERALQQAKVAVLLVSPDFLASEFIHNNELPPLLGAAEKEGVTIIWVPVRPCLYEDSVIGKYQAAYNPKTPLFTLPVAQQEIALAEIARLIKLTRLTEISETNPLIQSTDNLFNEQVPEPHVESKPPPSPPPSSPSPPPSLAAPPRRIWGQLLIVLVLGVLGGAGVYHLEKGWFEKAPISSPTVPGRSAQGNGTAESTAAPESAKPAPTNAATSSPRPDSVVKPPSLPPVQNIYGWSAPQVQALQEQTAQALKMKVEFKDNLKDGGQGPLMVVIPAGRFQMGSPDTELERQKDEQQHEVEVAAFAIGKYEVTFEEYDRFADATKSEKPADAGWGRWRRPVIHVPWFDAVAYADWLSKQTGQTYQLPTEAEWEYAARAGTTTPFYFGATISADQANYDGNNAYGNGHKGVYQQKTIEVGQFPPNAWRLHDMHGNVWEWTCSVYSENYDEKKKSEQRCAEPWMSGPRVRRGGSWNDAPKRLRGAARSSWGPLFYGTQDFGFRLARTFPSTL